MVSRFALGMIKSEKEKENTHDPEHFLTTLSFRQLASQFKISIFVSLVACFAGVRMSGVTMTDLAQVAPGSGT